MPPPAAQACLAQARPRRSACLSRARRCLWTPRGGRSATRWLSWQAHAWQRMCTIPPSAQVRTAAASRPGPTRPSPAWQGSPLPPQVAAWCTAWAAGAEPQLAGRACLTHQASRRASACLPCRHAGAGVEQGVFVQQRRGHCGQQPEEPGQAGVLPGVRHPVWPGGLGSRWGSPGSTAALGTPPGTACRGGGGGRPVAAPAPWPRRALLSVPRGRPPRAAPRRCGDGQLLVDGQPHPQPVALGGPAPAGVPARRHRQPAAAAAGQVRAHTAARPARRRWPAACRRISRARAGAQRCAAPVPWLQAPEAPVPHQLGAVPAREEPRAAAGGVRLGAAARRWGGGGGGWVVVGGGRSCSHAAPRYTAAAAGCGGARGRVAVPASLALPAGEDAAGQAVRVSSLKMVGSCRGADDQARLQVGCCMAGDFLSPHTMQHPSRQWGACACADVPASPQRANPATACTSTLTAAASLADWLAGGLAGRRCKPWQRILG